MKFDTQLIPSEYLCKTCSDELYWYVATEGRRDRAPKRTLTHIRKHDHFVVPIKRRS